jgi:hypothetical protein
MNNKSYKKTHKFNLAQKDIYNFIKKEQDNQTGMLKVLKHFYKVIMIKNNTTIFP